MIVPHHPEPAREAVAREMTALLDTWKSRMCSGELAAVLISAPHLSAALCASPAETSAETQGHVHPDDIAVDRFAAAMKAKLAKKRAEGRGGWEDKADCSNGFLSQLLVEHVDKGDPVDVGNLAMMIHQRGETIADERERYAAKVRQRREANDGRPGGWAEARETCQTCQGNGEIITDWDRYMHSHEMDAGC